MYMLYEYKIHKFSAFYHSELPITGVVHSDTNILYSIDWLSIDLPQSADSTVWLLLQLGNSKLQKGFPETSCLIYNVIWFLH